MNQLNQELHNNDSSYGSQSWAQLAKALNPLTIKGDINSLLDYGCGKGKLVERLSNELPNSIKISGYDPAIEKYEVKPEEPVDVVVCLDVK